MREFDELAKRMSKFDELAEKVNEFDEVGKLAKQMGTMGLSFRMPSLDMSVPEMPRFPSFWEVQAELFMDGLKDQINTLEESLSDDQELVMTCWHGPEHLQVLQVSMPSRNVVALHCIDAQGNQAQVTGHMNAVTFSFRVATVSPPAKPRKIGFCMP